MLYQDNDFALENEPTAYQISVHFMNLIQYTKSTSEVLNNVDKVINKPDYYMRDTFNYRQTDPALFRVLELVHFYGKDAINDYIQLVYQKRGAA